MNYENIQIQNETFLKELYDYREQIVKTQDFEKAATLASVITCLEICIEEIDKNTKLSIKRKREDRIHEIFK